MKIVMKLINLRANKNQALTRNEKPLERGGGAVDGQLLIGPFEFDHLLFPHWYWIRR